jgi:hypothetical protein
MTGTNCDLFTHNQSRSYLNHLVQQQPVSVLQQQAIIRCSYTCLDQSEGQDLVLLHSILKITIYFTTQLFTQYRANRERVGGSHVKSRVKNNKLKA